ncbi:MAG: hypothetical protein II058_03510, partial [Rhodocyclaceae bacterium]|nr:hypothetical protein [Rhodocyclaceae bacterium]
MNQKAASARETEKTANRLPEDNASAQAKRASYNETCLSDTPARLNSHAVAPSVRRLQRTRRFQQRLKFAAGSHFAHD